MTYMPSLLLITLQILYLGAQTVKLMTCWRSG